MSRARTQFQNRINERQSRPPGKRSSLGMHVTEVGERVLQTLCGEFDSHRLQIYAFVPQLEQEESCKFSFVSSTLTEGSTFVALSSNWLGNRVFTPETRVRSSLALPNDLVTQWLEYAPFKRRVVGSNPTRVIYRLIAQWTEHLPSKLMVLGSNPSKARCALEADRIMRRATDAELVGSIPTEGSIFRWRNWKRRSLTRIRLNVRVVHGRKHCIVAQLAEQPTVNRSVTGSNPVDAEHTEVIRPDEEPVLKTGARKGCRCESMPLPFFQPKSRRHAGIAQLAEHAAHIRKRESSILSSCSFLNPSPTNVSDTTERNSPK